MRKTMVIPTYWSRRSGEPWQEGDAIYDHPTPVDQEGTLERTLVSMKQFHEKDFKLVILICPHHPGGGGCCLREGASYRGPGAAECGDMPVYCGRPARDNGDSA